MNRNLIQLARLYGIQTSYTNMRKERRDADPESLLLILKAMGAGVNRMSDVPEALKRRKDELKKRLVEPIQVAWDGKLGTRRFEFGYHDVEIQGQPVFVISAPTKAYFPAKKAWGLFAPAYALHSKRNPAAGDLTDFENLMDWMYSLGGSVAGTLPLLGAFLDEPFEASPYTPSTRLFWNEFYVDLEKIPEFSGHRPVDPPKKTKFINYRAIMAHKRRVLEKLAETFFANANPGRRQAFDEFLRSHIGVEDYAKFRAITDRLRTGWQNWPTRLRDGDVRAGDYDEATKNYHLYAQWIIQEQLQGLSERAATRGQFLYLDLPLGIHGAGYDTWHDRHFFVEGVAGGAPPDPVFSKGQNWAFPPMNPESMRLNRYQYFIAFVRNHLHFAKLLRIDHVMGLHRLYWIPDELTGDKGVYVEYPAEELWAILSLETHMHRAGIVGENLGTVPPAVNAAMSRHDIRQMYVIQYEIMGHPDKPTLGRPPEKSLASVNTHDMPPFRSFVDGTDIDDRLDLGFVDEKGARKERKERVKMRKALASISNGPRTMDHGPFENETFPRALKFLSDSMANIVLINVEDLWEENHPQNVPATSKERPNWRRRVRPTIEQIRKMSDVTKVLSNVFAHRSRSLSV